MAAHAQQFGFGVAQTVEAVLRLGATLATYDPALYEGLVDPYDVLELS